VNRFPCLALLALLSVPLVTGSAAADWPDLLRAWTNWRRPPKPDVVYVPTPDDVVDRMLQLADVSKGDVVYDLGCGDGRIVVTAAKKFGCRGTGYDIDPQRVAESQENVKKHDLGDLVDIHQKDIFRVDLSGASVITLYLLPRLNTRLIPQLEKLKPGSRIVSHQYDMPGVEPAKIVHFTSREDSVVHHLYLWTIPLKKTAAGDEAKPHGSK